MLVDVEDISRIVDHLQVLVAGMAEELDLASGRTYGAGSMTVRAEQLVGRSGSVSASAAGVSEGWTGEGDQSAGGPGRVQFRNCADYLRARLGISRSEAKRRLVLAHSVLPGVTPSGAPTDPPLGTVGAALRSGSLSGRAATAICSAVERVRCVATSEQLMSMEHHLTLQAVEADEDVLRVLARRWETVLDQDGQEPTEKVLRSRQGVFLRGRRHGLHLLEIGATDEQFEYLSTVMNTATNPRTPGAGRRADDPRRLGDPDPSVGPACPEGGTGDGSRLLDPPEGPTRAQRLLDGLVGACRIALSTAQLPATGGHRPQVMVTIDYRDLLSDARSAAHAEPSPDVRGVSRRDRSDGAPTAGPMDRRGTGRAVFTEHLSARSIRRIACDADIIPLVLGGDGQVLDVGRAGQLFPPHLRRALIARDRGCAFPDCTIPASWCEAHHMTPWSQGGGTSIDNGVLLCAHHHHVIHLGHWHVESRRGIPWFTPPAHLNRHGTAARRNRYWHAVPGLPAGQGVICGPGSPGSPGSPGDLGNPGGPGGNCVTGDPPLVDVVRSGPSAGYG